MKPNRIVKAWIAVICSIALVGGGAALMSSPASAQASINWKHIWKTQIKPRADKRYYKKSTANGLFARVGSSYTKAESDAKYTPTGTAFTKAESDARYAPFPSVIRGTYTAVGDVTAAGRDVDASISYGVNLATAPTVNYLNVGAAPTAACPGTAAAPNAAPGNLCLYEAQNVNVNTRRIFNGTGTFGLSSTFGADVEISATAAGQVYVYGTWAVRPAGGVSASKVITGHRTGGVRAGR